MRQAPTGVLRIARPDSYPRSFGQLSLLKRLASDEGGDAYVALRADGVDRVCVANVLSKPVVSRPGVLDALRAEAGWLVARVHGNLV